MIHEDAVLINPAERENPPLLSRSTWLLLPVLLLAFYVAFIPHLDYAFPVHLDEWIHMANAEAIMQYGSTTYPNPLGSNMQTISTNLELGFQLFWGVFQQISGIPWPDIVRFFPSVILVFTALAAYILANRLGFGWEAAIFASLIPTTIGILGPAFLVPVALGIMYIPLSLFVAFNFKTWQSYAAIFIFTCFLLAIHAPSAICLVIVLFPYIVLNLKGNFKHSLALALAVLVPFLAPFPWIFSMLLPTARGLLTPQSLPQNVDLPMIIQDYGYLPAALCMIGTFWLAFKGGKRYYGLALGLLALLLMLVTFYTFHYGLSIMYERGLTFMELVMGIIAGAGLMAIRMVKLPDGWGPAFLRRHAGNIAAIIVVGITLGISLPNLHGISYYNMINNDDYQAFTWIKNNLGKEYQTAVLDPWEGVPFVAVSGKRVYSWTFVAPTVADAQARAFLASGCADTDFLRQNGITIVYTTKTCTNPDLTRVAPNTYVLKLSPAK